jgi:DNA-binding transcriptional ArsR family regulator
MSASADTPYEPNFLLRHREQLMKVDKPVFDWAALVPKFVHPHRVAIIEALLYVGRPMSATDLSKSFGAAGNGLSYVAYHVTSLAKIGAIRQVSERQGRGAGEKFYFFS